MNYNAIYPENVTHLNRAADDTYVFTKLFVFLIVKRIGYGKVKAGGVREQISYTCILGGISASICKELMRFAKNMISDQ